MTDSRKNKPLRAWHEPCNSSKDIASFCPVLSKTIKGFFFKSGTMTPDEFLQGGWKLENASSAAAPNGR